MSTVILIFRYSKFLPLFLESRLKKGVVNRSKELYSGFKLYLYRWNFIHKRIAKSF